VVSERSSCPRRAGDPPVASGSLALPGRRLHGANLYDMSLQRLRPICATGYANRRDHHQCWGMHSEDLSAIVLFALRIETSCSTHKAAGTVVRQDLAARTIQACAVDRYLPELRTCELYHLGSRGERVLLGRRRGFWCPGVWLLQTARLK
jgi:hypothetical protein